MPGFSLCVEDNRMLLRCDCGAESTVNLHKDGYEIIKVICVSCRYIKHLKTVTGEVRITLRNCDLYFVRKTVEVTRRRA